MTRNLLTEYSSIKAYSKNGAFATGNTVTITVYKNGSGTAETLSSNSCTEINGSGIFYWPFSNLDTAPTGLSEYYWIMTNGAASSDGGYERFGGWPELLTSLPQSLDPASICRITTPLYEVDGSCVVDPNTFSNQNTSANNIELKTAFHDGTRYFKLGKYSPSYDESTGQAFWLIPRGATVDVNLSSFGVSKTGALVPASSTIDLKTWLDSLG